MTCPMIGSVLHIVKRYLGDLLRCPYLRIHRLSGQRRQLRGRIDFCCNRMLISIKKQARFLPAAPAFSMLLCSFHVSLNGCFRGSNRCFRAIPVRKTRKRTSCSHLPEYLIPHRSQGADQNLTEQNTADRLPGADRGRQVREAARHAIGID